MRTTPGATNRERDCCHASLLRVGCFLDTPNTHATRSIYDLSGVGEPSFHLGMLLYQQQCFAQRPRLSSQALQIEFYTWGQAARQEFFRKHGFLPEEATTRYIPVTVEGPVDHDLYYAALRAERSKTKDDDRSTKLSGATLRVGLPRQPLAKMAKAAASDADQVIFDLEDACAVSQKEAARQTVIEALRTLDFGGKTRAFRVNDVRTRFCYRDLIEVVEAAGGALDGVVVPKVNGPEDVIFVDRLLTQIEEKVGLPARPITIEALIESADGVLHAEQIASATPRMGGLVFGLVDFAGDIGAKETGAEQFFYYNYAKAKTIVAARAAGITCVDGVTLAIRDLEACRRDARMAARMGFDGKWAIHPAQVAVINEAFTPAPEEIARAQRIIDAYARADVEEGVGALVIDDEMVDAATLRLEWKKLAIARKAGLA